MQVGNLVTFKKRPTVNTPGAPSSETPGVGVVMGDRYSDGGFCMFIGDVWCKVMWPNGELNKCFKEDLVVLEESK